MGDTFNLQDLAVINIQQINSRDMDAINAAESEKTGTMGDTFNLQQLLSDSDTTGLLNAAQLKRHDLEALISTTQSNTFNLQNLFGGQTSGFIERDRTYDKASFINAKNLQNLYGGQVSGFLERDRTYDKASFIA